MEKSCWLPSFPEATWALMLSDTYCRTHELKIFHLFWKHRTLNNQRKFGVRKLGFCKHWPVFKNLKKICEKRSGTLSMKQNWGVEKGKEEQKVRKSPPSEIIGCNRSQIFTVDCKNNGSHVKIEKCLKFVGLREIWSNFGLHRFQQLWVWQSPCLLSFLWVDCKIRLQQWSHINLYDKLITSDHWLSLKGILDCVDSPDEHSGAYETFQTDRQAQLCLGSPMKQQSSQCLDLVGTIWLS